MLEVLAEAEGLRELDVPGELRERHGGPLGLEEPRLLANFVSSIDGVVASESDRFMIGLLLREHAARTAKETRALAVRPSAGAGILPA